MIIVLSNMVPLPSGCGLEAFDNFRDLRDLANPNVLADLVGGDAAVAFVVADRVDRDAIGFVAGQAAHGCREFINRVGHDIRQPGDEGGDEDVGHRLLLFGIAGRRPAVGVNLGDLGQVLGDLARHFRELQVPRSDGLDRTDVVAEFLFLVALAGSVP